MPGTLYVVATPIGNLGDVTLRALETLRAVSVIACEDTRVTRKLLIRYGITTRTLSYHEHNEKTRVPELGAILLEGRDVALVSDAGTPGVSDPGYRLLAWARENEVSIRSIPGPSAVVTAVALSGFAGGGFCFQGFLPLKPKARREAIAALGRELRPVVLFETARRAPRLLIDLAAVMGDRRAFLGRELTKLHEEHRIGPLADLARWAKGAELRGEITLVVDALERPAGASAVTEASLGNRFSALVRQGLTRREAVKALARELSLPSREIYRQVLSEKPRQDPAVPGRS